MAKGGKTKHSQTGGGIAAWIKKNPSQAKLALLGVLVLVLLVVVAVGMLGSGGKKPGRSQSARAAAAGSTESSTAGTTAPPPPPPTQGKQQPAEDNAQKEKDNAQTAAAAPRANGETGQPSPAAQTATQPAGPSVGADTAAASVRLVGPPAPTQQAAGPSKPDRSPAAPAGQSSRPANVSDWKMPDYFSARAEGDARLIEAVGQLGERFAGSPKADRVAEILTALLAPPGQPQAEGQQGSPPSTGAPPGGSTELLAALVAALGENGSDTAQKTLGQLLAGELPTEDDKAAALAALKALADHPSAENEALLFRALTAVEELRPAGRGQLTAEELRDQALSLVESQGSERLRLKLAEYLGGGGATEDLRTVLGELLEQDNPDNLAAQLVLYQQDGTAEETKAKLEGYFTAHSSQAMAQILGISAEAVKGTSPPPRERQRPRAPRPRPISTADGRQGPAKTHQPPPERPNTQGAESQPADPDLVFRLARHLWGPQCVAMLTDRLGKLDSLEGHSQLVALAGTIPVDAIRAALLDTVGKHWDDGPGVLESAGLSGELVSDPGLLLVVKMLCRKTPTTRAAGKDAVEKFQKNKEAWAKSSDDLVYAWCERLHAAALARTEAAQATTRQPAAENPAASLPIKLHADAKLAAEYHLVFPGEAGAKLAGVAAGPLEIHYVRIEEKARRKARLGYYKRQLKARSSDVRQLENVDWLESFRSLPEANLRRSIDVLITRAAQEPGSGRTEKPNEAQKDKDKAEEDEDLTVEVLSIEITDPAKN